VNCRDVILEVSSYLDGDLTPEALVELKRHLDRCLDCRVIVDTVRKTIDIYCQAEPIPLPEDVRTRLHEALARRLGRRPS
jgi:predicted anti-sigma-YlaC factor YlaD